MAFTLSYVHPALQVSIQVPVVITYTDSRGMNRVLGDEINAVDLATIAVIRALADTALADNLNPVLVFAKAVQELAVANDGVAVMAQFFRAIADLASAADAPSIAAVKALLDQASAADGTDIITGKSLSDPASSSDAMQFAGTKTVGDAAVIVELADMHLNKATADAATAVDIGQFLMTDYGDFTYFADDFVGISTTF